MFFNSDGKFGRFPVASFIASPNFAGCAHAKPIVEFSLSILSKTFKPVVISKNPLDGLHTIFQLDCVFVPSFEKLNNLDEEKLKKLILIMFYSYKSYDFVDYLIRLLDKKAKSNLIYDYRNLLKNTNIIKKY